MGNVWSNQYVSGVSPRLVTSIRTNAIWADMLVDSNSRVVDFSEDNVAAKCYAPTTSFEPEMLEKIPKKWRIIILFPWQTENDKKVLFSDQYRDLASLNEVLNERLHKNPTAANQAVICWTDFVYKVTGVKGSLYLRWAQEISIYNSGDIEVDKMRRDIPLLVNTDGKYGQKAFYPLMSGMSSYEVLFLAPERVTFSQSVTDTLYPCDKREPPPVLSACAKKLDADEVRVRRERLTIPEHERDKYRPPPAAAVTAELSYFASSSLAVNVAAHGSPEDYLCGTGTNDREAEESDLPDDVLEFFAVETLPKPATDTIAGDVAQHKIALSFLKEKDNDDDDDDGPYVAPGALTQRNRVPRSLLPRSEHRTGSVGRIRYVPREPSVNLELEVEMSPVQIREKPN